MPLRSLLPIVYLDVDGPLLPFGEGDGVRPAGVGDDRYGRLDVAVGRELGALPAELVWATAWGVAANQEISPRLGLPQLRVVEWPEVGVEEAVEDEWLGLHWKTRAVVAHAEGRPFVWVDDEVTDADREWVGGHHAGVGLLYWVESWRGLGVGDVVEVGRWLRGEGRR